MASPPTLDLDALVQPIPGDNAAGAPLAYDVRLKLEELRKEINPDDYDADDPRRPSQYRKPEWAGIIALASDTLTNSSKDLLAAARLVEALAIEHGFAGLRDGLDLLTRLVTQAWDRLHPQIEEGDTAEVREGPFKWLNQDAYGARFPTTLRQTTLITVDDRAYSLADWQDTAKRAGFEAALTKVSAETCQALLDDMKAAKQKLQELSEALSEKMGEFVPDLNSSEGSEHIGAALNDCIKVAQQIVAKKGGAAAPASSAPAPVAGTTGPAVAGQAVSHTLATRADAYRMLTDAADLLQKIEPHSPIPYLVRRAVRLGDLKFPELMRALIRENAVLDELNRVMGIEPEASS